MSATRLIEGALDKVRATADVKTVYGEPTNQNKKLTIAGAVGAGVGMVLGLILGRRRRPEGR